MSSQAAREMVEPMQLLLRELLRDDNTEVYLEALNLLKFIVGSLASHMSALDLHLVVDGEVTHRKVLSPVHVAACPP